MSRRSDRTPDVDLSTPPVETVIERARAGFVAAFGEAPRVAVVPGRVNLIGDHTDYSGGFVLPAAIDRHVVAAFAPRSDGVLHVRSRTLDAAASVDVAAAVPRTEPDWFSYAAGVGWALRQTGHDPPGLNVLVDATLRPGRGLSSSAAFEVALARAWYDVMGVRWQAMTAARLCQTAENDFVGMRCGLMDQAACAASRSGMAMLLDCRSEAIEHVPIPPTVALVVMDSGVRRSLTSSPYNARRLACEEAAAIVREIDPRIDSLRDADAGLLEAAADRLGPDRLALARHVVAECRRPPAMADRLRVGDLDEAGRLMNESHASLRDLFRASCAELDALTDAARSHSACHGARMTGAGFGGCGVALVDADSAASLAAHVTGIYRARTGRTATMLVTQPVDGAWLV